MPAKMAKNSKPNEVVTKMQASSNPVSEYRWSEPSLCEDWGFGQQDISLAAPSFVEQSKTVQDSEEHVAQQAMDRKLMTDVIHEVVKKLGADGLPAKTLSESIAPYKWCLASGAAPGDRHSDSKGPATRENNTAHRIRGSDSEMKEEQLENEHDLSHSNISSTTSATGRLDTPDIDMNYTERRFEALCKSLKARLMDATQAKDRISAEKEELHRLFLASEERSIKRIMNLEIQLHEATAQASAEKRRADDSEKRTDAWQRLAVHQKRQTETAQLLQKEAEKQIVEAQACAVEAEARASRASHQVRAAVIRMIQERIRLGEVESQLKDAEDRACKAEDRAREAEALALQPGEHVSDEPAKKNTENQD